MEEEGEEKRWREEMGGEERVQTVGMLKKIKECKSICNKRKKIKFYKLFIC